MKEAVTKVIDTLTQDDLHGVFQKFLERYKCVAAGGDYFEGGLEFHVCTINKCAHTKKVLKLILCSLYIYLIEWKLICNYWCHAVLYDNNQVEKEIFWRNKKNRKVSIKRMFTSYAFKISKLKPYFQNRNEEFYKLFLWYNYSVSCDFFIGWSNSETFRLIFDEFAPLFFLQNSPSLQILSVRLMFSWENDNLSWTSFDENREYCIRIILSFSKLSKRLNSWKTID